MLTWTRQCAAKADLVAQEMRKARNALIGASLAEFVLLDGRDRKIDGFSAYVYGTRWERRWKSKEIVRKAMNPYGFSRPPELDGFTIRNG